MDVVEVFRFHGRIGRAAWWGIGFISLIVSGVGSLLLDLGESTQSHLYAYAGVAVLLLNLVMTLATNAKRYHDRNKSGWWLLIMVIPVIGWLWSFIELGFLAGTEGYNRYGAAGSGSPFSDETLPTHGDPVYRVRD